MRKQISIILFIAMAIGFSSLSLFAKRKKKAKSVLKEIAGQVNKPFYHENSPSVTADGKTIFYLTQNPNGDGVQEREDWNISTSRFEDGKWLEGRPIRTLNSKEYEGYPSISADGRTLFFSSNQQSQAEFKDKDLFYSTYLNGKWSAPTNMGRSINIKGLDEVGGSISPNGQIFVFTARNRDDSLGKEDIYISYRDKNGAWKMATNLGRPVNSKAREFAPYLASDGKTLYFSSDRRGGRGGLDLYKSILKKGKWSRPKNLGKKINTKGHDLGISIPAKGDIFYTSHISEDGDYNIFSGTLPPKARPFKVILVKGKVRDKLSRKYLKADIYIEDLDSGKPIGFYQSNSDDGTFLVSLREGTRYSFSAQSKGYFAHNEAYNFKKIGKYREENLKINLVPIKQGEKAVVKNIFFRPGSAKLGKRSRLALVKLILMMQKNTNLRFEIQGHTDNVNSARANQILSESRANNVRAYMIKRGIKASRLTAKGYGEKKPIVKNNSKANKAKNRRIEFFVLKK